MADWTDTVRQVLPRFLAVARQMRPSFHAASLSDVSPRFLAEHDVKLLIWDVDGTLMPWHGTAVAPEQLAGWDRLRAVKGLAHLILSNCGDQRFEELGRVFPDVPVVKGYRTPNGPTWRRMYQGLETWGDGGSWDPTTDVAVKTIRKPEAVLLGFALEIGRELTGGDVAVSEALMVGDQYFTDIAGANEAGVPTLKVRTMARGSFPAPVAWMQRLEAVLFRLLHGRVHELPSVGGAPPPAGQDAVG